MATQVVSVEANVSNGDFSLMGVQGRVCLCEAITLKHVQHSGFACIVEAQEYDVGAFLEEAHPLHSALEEVHNEHFCFCFYNFNYLYFATFIVNLISRFGRVLYALKT